MENNNDIMEMESIISNKRAVIVGASSGIGYETAKKLLRKGWVVFNVSRGECEIDGVTDLIADVTRADELREAIDEAGEIDALIYSAGFSMAAPIEYAEEDDWKYLFDVNYFGALRAISYAVPHMKTAGGHIVLVSSMGGVLPISYDAFYSGSKAALDMLAKSAAAELKRYNIKVCAVQPGGTSTDFTFKRKVYGLDEVGEYGDDMAKAVYKLGDMEQGGMSPKEVAATIVGVLEMSAPPLATACGLKNKTFKLAQKLLPQKLSLSINEGMYHQ